MTSLIKKFTLLLSANLIFSLTTSALTSALPTSLILITELQTGQGSSEFIEIENTSNSPLDLSTWKFQYHSAGSTTWSNKVLTFVSPTITILNSGDRALFTATGYNPAGSAAMAHFPSGLADTAGSVRIAPASLDQTQGDILTWGVTDPPTCSIAPKHADNQSLKRFPSGDGAIVDTGSSGKDFYVSDSPSPDSIDTQDPFSIDEVVNYCGKPADISTDPQAPGTIEDPGSPPLPTYQKVEITELFPDPVTPEADENNEYIELFNPNAESVNLSGYKLQAGINSTYSYTIGDITLQPGEYYAISRKDSKLTLSNTSSKVRLLSPNDEVVSETDPYEQTNPAESWQLYDGVWQWSSNPTPSMANVQLSPGASTAAAAKVSAKPAAKTTKPKATKKAAAKKAATSSKPKASAKDSGSNAFTYTDDMGTTKLQPYILWGAGLLLFGYGLWEYRWDLLGLFKKTRREGL